MMIKINWVMLPFSWSFIFLPENRTNELEIQHLGIEFLAF